MRLSFPQSQRLRRCPFSKIGLTFRPWKNNSKFQPIQPHSRNFKLRLYQKPFWGCTFLELHFKRRALLLGFTSFYIGASFFLFRKPCIDSYRAQSESHVHSATKLHKILYLELCNDFFRNAFRIKENTTFQHMIIANILLRVEKERCSLALQLSSFQFRFWCGAISYDIITCDKPHEYSSPWSCQVP